jgi:uncharacterized membrane protein YfcA
MTVIQAVVLFAAAATAGAINAVAGGGTMVTFPTLLWSGLGEKLANTTSSVALWPGSVGGMWGFRRELRRGRRWLFLLVPSFVGGAAGAVLLYYTPPKIFGLIIPYLILFATTLFMAQEPITRAIQRREVAGEPSRTLVWSVTFFQLAIAVYGAYFGAGIGILMLSALSLLRIGDIHLMNALKSTFAACINGMAAVFFIATSQVDWQRALVMLAGSLLGGYGGASFARRLGQRTVRWIVICIGFSITAVMLYRQFHPRSS